MIGVWRRVRTVLRNANARLVGALEVAFYWYGKTIATVPILIIVLCLVLAAACGIGLAKFHQETNPTHLWTPKVSEFVSVQEWVEENFASDIRLNVAIYENDNVLDKKVLLEMLRVHEVLVTTNTGDDTTWNSTCWVVPTLPTFSIGRRRRNIMSGVRPKRQTNNIDFSSILSRDGYCELLESQRELCLESGLLEVFGYDRDFLANLTQEQILNEINDATTSIITGFPLNVSQYLAHVQRDGEGYILRAGAASHMWFTKVNRSALEAGATVWDAGTGTQVDEDTAKWEQQVVNNLLDPAHRPPEVKFYLMSASSFGTVSGENSRDTLLHLSFGFGIVFVFMVLMLGRRNQVEARPLLSLLGLMCVGLAIIVSYGICAACDVPYGPVNSILPFLLLGLGIDDIFVILEEWRRLGPRDQQQQLADRIGATLGRAGVGITVTSLTDFLAFAVGSTTNLPALRYFCIYAAVGTAAVYFFQATFFVAWLTLDQRRLEDRRHGFFWCWKMSPTWSPSGCSEHDLCHEFFSRVLAKVLLQPCVRISVLLLTGVIFGVSTWGLANLRQEFEPVWFLPQDSYLYKYFEKERQYFPFQEPGSVYFSNISLVTELPKIQGLTERLRSSEYIAKVDSWVEKFVDYWDDTIKVDPSQFPGRLTRFLFSVSGAPYRDRNFKFNSTLTCKEDAPPVSATSIDFSYRFLSSSQEKVKAMEAVLDIVHSANLSGEARVWAPVYATWETNNVIKKELYRNLGIAIVVVAVATLVLLDSVEASCMVVLCVLFTLVDVAALMHWWGLTINTVSCIDFVLSVGLCVDYAAHVAHTFLTMTGDRTQRVADALATIGPPVLSGGFSTFLAFVFLANSSSHIFQSFFKVCFGVCLYGLYHGLVFLPALLSLVGPESRNSVTPHPNTSRTPSSTRVSSHPIDHKNEKSIGTVIYDEEWEDTESSGRCEKGVFFVEGQGDREAVGRDKTIRT